MKPLIFLEPEDAVARLESLCKKLGRQIEAQPDKSVITPLISYCIALDTQAKALKYLNEFVEVDVPWDDNIGLPSSPSMAADVKTYVERMDLDGQVRGLLLSFSEWSLFKREEMKCACGWSKNKNGRFARTDSGLERFNR